MRSSIKPFVLPAAIACGLLFHDAIKFIAPLSPYLIFMMLLLTYEHRFTQDTSHTASAVAFADTNQCVLDSVCPVAGL